MSSILPIIADEKVNKKFGFGKGSIILVSDECVMKLTPTTYNGVADCITLEVSESNFVDVSDVYRGMSKRELNDVLEKFADQMPDSSYLTLPMCHRRGSNAWLTASTLLQTLADAAADRSRQLAAAEAEEEKKKVKRV